MLLGDKIGVTYIEGLPMPFCVAGLGKAGWCEAAAHAMLVFSVDFTLSAMRFLERFWPCFAVMENYRDKLFKGQGVSSENN